MDCSITGLSVPHHLPGFTQIHIHYIGDPAISAFDTSSPSALYLSQHQGLFQWVSCLHQVSKILELQHQSFQWVFRVDFPYDWLVWSPCYPRDSQESSPAQFEGIRFLVSAFFMVQVSQPYMTTEKTIALTIWTSIDRVMSLLFDTLSRFVIAFLPRSNCLLISWLQSPFTVILEPRRRSLSLLPPFPLLFAL